MEGQENMEKKISSAVIKRLPRYYRYLSELLDEGMDRISSQELSVKMNVTASQIRQDFAETEIGSMACMMESLQRFVQMEVNFKLFMSQMIH